MILKLYHGGDLITLETHAEPAEAVLTSDGTILSVGSYSSLKDQAKSLMQNSNAVLEEIDLHGCTMLPAFLDPHSHFSGYANSLLQAPLDECISFSEIQSALADFIQSNHVPEGNWVFGKGYDHNQLTEKTHPRREILDQVAPNHPLVIIHASGHVGVFNTCALNALGVDGSTIAPEGGLIELRDGIPSGYMEENAFIQYLGKAPMPDLSALMQAYEEVQHRYASYGITTIQEGMLPMQLVPLYQALLAQNKLWLDVVGYADIHNADAILDTFPQHIRTYHQHFKLGGYKIFLDGSPQGRTAWLRSPYLPLTEQDDPSYCGYGTLSDEQVLQDIQIAMQDRMQLLAHCNGDAAAEQLLRCWKKAGNDSLRDVLRPVMIHAQLLAPDQLPDVHALHITPSFFAAHVYHWGDIHLKNFGRTRADHISCAGSALRQNIRFTFHQDSPVIRPDMLETIWCAVNRQTKNGEFLGISPDADERISVLDAIRAVTINAAWQYHEETLKGSIRAGKKADFVILDRNPLKTDPTLLRSIQILQTIQNDRIIYQNSSGTLL